MTFLLAFLFSLQPISVKVSPLVSFAPSTLRIEIRVQPIESDRRIEVVIDGPNYGRASGWDIEGAHSPKLYSWPLKDLPEGSYEITAQIGSRLGARATDRQTVEVR